MGDVRFVNESDIPQSKSSVLRNYQNLTSSVGLSLGYSELNPYPKSWITIGLYPTLIKILNENNINLLNQRLSNREKSYTQPKQTSTTMLIRYFDAQRDICLVELVLSSSQKKNSSFLFDLSQKK